MEGGLFFLVELDVGFGFAHDAGFLGAGGVGAGEVFYVGLEGGGVVAVDADAGGGGDGILVGAEEEEFPLIDVGLVADALLDFCPVVLGGGVFCAVGEDGDEDVAGAIGLGHGGEAGAEAVDGEADSIEQCGGATGLIGDGGEGGDLGDGEPVVEDVVAVIEEDEGELGGHGRAVCVGGVLLAVEELVKASEGGVVHGGHGAGAVEDEGDFCVHDVVVFWFRFS